VGCRVCVRATHFRLCASRQAVGLPPAAATPCGAMTSSAPPRQAATATHPNQPPQGGSAPGDFDARGAAARCVVRDLDTKQVGGW